MRNATDVSDRVAEEAQGQRRPPPRPSRRYWVCHLSGWFVHGLMWVPFFPLESVAALTVAAIVVTHQFRNLIHRWGWRRLPLRELVPRVVAASLVSGAVIAAAAAPWIFPHLPPENVLLAVFAFFSTFAGISLGWFVIYFAYHFREQVREAEAEKWRLAVAARDAELAAMRAQLNPHFLFNSLNSLRGLLGEDPARAQHAVTDLAALLRYTLRLSRSRTTSLREELDAVRHFLALEHLRFEGQKPLVNRSLAQLEAKLDPEIFFRVNRSQIINLNAVRAIKPWFKGRLLVELEGGPEVTMSRRRAAAFQERMGM